MTALNEFERLECSGVWRASSEAQRRDVIVSIGNATLVISDQQDIALSHWSLPAVERVNPGQRPAQLRPGPESAETLELLDDTMIAAIAKVQTAIRRRRPHPGRLRFWIVTGISLAVLGFLVFWLPNAMIRYTASVVPAATRSNIGQSILENINRVSGAQCATEPGSRALSLLSQRLLGPDQVTLVVLSGGIRSTGHLPGGIIFLDRSLVEDFEDPEVVAGFILAEDARRKSSDPLTRMLDELGFYAVFRLLTTGRIPPESLAAYGESLLTAPQLQIPDDTLLDSFGKAGIRSSPYAYAVDISGETTISLIEADPIDAKDVRRVLDDGDWVSLQEICGD